MRTIPIIEPLRQDEREELARLLEIVARDGLPGPRDLDVAIEAIEQVMFLFAQRRGEAGL